MSNTFYAREFVVGPNGSIVYGPISNLELIPMSVTPGVPPRPTPGPTPPDPNAPHPEHPIMLPGMPGWGEPPVGGQPPTGPGGGQAALVRPWPSGEAPPTPDANWEPAQVVLAGGAVSAALIGPHIEHNK